MHDGGYVLVMRTTGAVSTGWPIYGATAAAVARSIHCNIPLRASGVDWTSESPDARARGENGGVWVQPVAGNGELSSPEYRSELLGEPESGLE